MIFGVGGDNLLGGGEIVADYGSRNRDSVYPFCSLTQTYYTYSQGPALVPGLPPGDILRVRPISVRPGIEERNAVKTFYLNSAAKGGIPSYIGHSRHEVLDLDDIEDTRCFRNRCESAAGREAEVTIVSCIKEGQSRRTIVRRP